MDQEHPGEGDHQIDEEIMQENDQEVMFEFQVDPNFSQSYDVSGSKVTFPRENFVIRNDGASTVDIQISINPQFIKEGEKIGSGTAGSVYVADYTLNGITRKVAIKEIPLHAQKKIRDQFFNDLRVFLKANNPHLVQFYGCYYKQGYLHEVMEYMDLGTLRDLIEYFKNNNKMLVEPVLAHFSRCILQGLLAIHQLKQIHRDIKPQNILVNSKGEVKITDFGVSKTLDKTFGLAKTAVGTIMYMSPERMNTNGHTYNCDVWSFGLVLYELTTLRMTPYIQKPDETEYSLMKRVEISSPPTFQPSDNRSPQFDHFLSRCLEKDFQYRANVQELLNHNWMKSQLSQISEKQFRKYLMKLAQEIKS